MQFADKRRSLSITQSRPRRVAALITLVMLSALLVVCCFGDTFYKTATLSPDYMSAETTLTADRQFSLEQSFTPMKPGIKQLIVSYRNLRETAQQDTVTLSLLSPDGAALLRQTVSLSAQKGEMNLRLSVAGLSLTPGETYAIQLSAADESFSPGAHLFPVKKAQGNAFAPAVWNGAPLSGGESLILQGSYRYFDIFSCAAAALLILLIVFLCLFNFHFGKKATLLYNVFCTAAAPAVLFCMVEWLNFGGPGQISSLHIFLNLCWYAVVYALFFLLCNRLSVTLLLGSLFFYIFGIVNHLVLLFRGSVLLPADLVAASTALKVLQKYNLKPTAALILSFFCFIALMLAVLRANFRLPGRKARFIGAAALLPFCVVFPTLYCNADFLETVNLTPYHWQQTAACRQRGFVANFTSNIPSMMVAKPEGYDPAALAVQLDGQRIPSMALPAASEKAPHIVVVMNESFSDLSLYGDLRTDHDPLEFFHSLSGGNVIKGQVTVPVFGGSTCNSEFEFLTGGSAAFLPSGSVPFQQFVKSGTPSLVSHLGALGYQRLALHPYSPYGWSRSTVYPAFGFEQFYSQNAMPHAKKLRWYISDKSNYDKLTALFEAEKDEGPLFLFNVTIQNHGGYDYTPFSDTIHLQGYQQPYPQAQQYLTLLKASDDALKSLISYLESQTDPVIFCFFGDHLPNLENDFYEELFGNALGGNAVNEAPAAHRTPFLIWANFPLEDAASEYGLISVNYLSALVTRAAGLPTSPFQNFLLTLKDSVPIVSTTGIFDAQGNKLDPDDQEGLYYQLLLTYRQLQYHALFDGANRIDRLFSPSAKP